MPTSLPATAAAPGRSARGGPWGATRRSERQLWLMLVLGLMLVFVRGVDLHFHAHIGAPASAMHLADVSTAHDAGHGDLDVDIQGQGSPHQLPSVDLPSMLLHALPLPFVLLVAGEVRPRWTAAPATPPPWRQRANTAPPAAGPPRYR